MAKSRDEEPGSEPAAADPSVSVEPLARAPVERDGFSDPTAWAVASPVVAAPMADPPSHGEQAFCEIVKQHRPYLLHLASRLSRNQQVAEDLVQEALRRALRRVGDLRPDSHVRAWLSKIVTRVFLDHNKHEDVVERAMAKLAADELVVDDPVGPETRMRPSDMRSIGSRQSCGRSSNATSPASLTR